MTPEKELIDRLTEERATIQHRFEALSSGVWPTDSNWQKLDAEVGLSQVMHRPMQKPMDFETIMIFTSTIAQLDAIIAKLSQ